MPHLGCSVSRAPWRLWSGTEGTANYFLALSLIVHAPGSQAGISLHPLENTAVPARSSCSQTSVLSAVPEQRQHPGDVCL